MSYSSAIGEFVIGFSPLGSGFSQPFGLTQIIPSYVYLQYSDDQAIQAFVASYNNITQGYLNWFNTTPLAVYQNANISGLLLDWIAEGIYGLSRPTLANFSQSTRAGYATSPYNKIAYAQRTVTVTGSAVAASDDIYKRVLTWWLYRGDGQQMTLQWLKRRVARFLYGANGSDISYPVYSSPSVAIRTNARSSGFSTQPYATTAYANRFGVLGKTSGSQIVITVQNNSVGQSLQLLIEAGLLALPFQYQITVVL